MVEQYDSFISSVYLSWGIEFGIYTNIGMVHQFLKSPYVAPFWEQTMTNCIRILLLLLLPSVSKVWSTHDHEITMCNVMYTQKLLFKSSPLNTTKYGIKNICVQAHSVGQTDGRTVVITWLIINFKILTYYHCTISMHITDSIEM